MTDRIALLALVTSLAGPALAQGTFQKIVATEEVTPGIDVNFGELRPPVIDHSRVAFCGQSYLNFGKSGVYAADLLGNIAPIATDQTASPSGGGNFRDMCSSSELPSIDGGRVAFYAYNSTTIGTYLHDGESLSTIVDENTDFPGTSVAVNRFDSPSLDGRVAITMSNSPATPYFSGVYSFLGATLFTVDDTNPAPPGETFFNVSQGTVSGSESGPDEGAYAWAVNDTPSGPYSIWRRSYAGSSLGDRELVVESGTEKPGGQAFFGAVHSPQLDRSDPDQLCFLEGAPIAGVYRFDGAGFATVADTATAIPNGTGDFTGFGLYCAIDAGDVVFTGRGSGGQWGVYARRANGTLERIADTSTLLGGETPYIFETSREAISDGRIVFAASAGPQRTIWVTPAPEPPAAGAAASALLALAGVAWRRQPAFQ